MRSILAIALVYISLTLVVCEVNLNERSRMMAEAMDCCTTACSHDQYSLLRSKFDLYVAQYGQDSLLETYLEKVFTGELCNKKAPKASFAGITCPYGPYDVAGGDVIVNCTYDVYHSTGVYYGSINAYAVSGGGSVSYMGSSGYYYDAAASSVFWSGTVQLLVRQYSPAGNYSVNLFAYAVNYTTYVSAYGVFGVKATLNDNQPPAITAINIPPINIYDMSSAFAAVTATDDISGVAQVQLTVFNTTTSIAYGYYTAPYSNGKYTAQTTVVAPLSIYFYYGVGANIMPGRYNISLYVYDAVGRYKYIYYNDLVLANLQLSVVIDQSYCPAGKYLPYGQVGACLPCPFGAFSPNFAFRCKACPAGTWPNATGSCAPCPAGSYGAGGSSYCTYCPAGTYSYSTGSRTCQPCTPGTYSSAGATTCSYCPSGTYSAAGGATAAGCTPCVRGSASSYAYFACTQCEAGYYAAVDGLSYCNQCPPGSYSASVGATACTSCPVGQTGPMASNSVLNCA